VSAGFLAENLKGQDSNVQHVNEANDTVDDKHIEKNLECQHCN